jgi:8-oxo-dGTP pyrophosphatase MutT (NUDIX family)
VALRGVASMTQVVVPSKASTIIVVRHNSTDGFDVLLTRRPQKMLFLGGYLVFPGGVVEKEDCSDRMISRCTGLSPFEAQAILGGGLSPEISFGYWVAAARELFEETGIHFFVSESGRLSDAKVEDLNARLSKKRKALADRRIDLPYLLESEQSFCDLSRMIYLFHRITPEKNQIRFDTRFYLAALPINQTSLTSSEEVEESFWITPQAALERVQSGNFPMLPPTIIALQQLAAHRSWPDLCRAFRLS